MGCQNKCSNCETAKQETMCHHGAHVGEQLLRARTCCEYEIPFLLCQFCTGCMLDVYDDAMND